MHRDDALDRRNVAETAQLLDHRVAVNADQSRARIGDYVTRLFDSAGGVERDHRRSESEHRLSKTTQCGPFSARIATRSPGSIPMRVSPPRSRCWRSLMFIQE